MHDRSGADAVRDVLLALVTGAKRQAADRGDFLDRVGYGLRLLLR